MTEIYSTKNCHKCIDLKAFLRTAGIAFLEVDITENIDARNEILDKGFRQVPVVRIGDDFIAGIEMDKIKKLLNL